MVLSTAKTNAATYDVTAKVHAPLSSQPAIINSPVNGFVTSTRRQVISGSCPTLNPQLFVLLWRGNDLLGSTVCSGGNFAIEITLVQGSNNIIPKLKNVTNDAGVDGIPVTVIYDPSKTPTAETFEGEQTTPEPTSTSITQSQLTVIPENDFVLIMPSGEASLTINIKDGEAPYTMTIDWGDGTIETLSFDTGGEKTLKHTFSSAHDSSISIKITDKNGRTYSLVLGAETSSPYTTTTPTTKPEKSNIIKILTSAPVIVSTVLVAGFSGMQIHKINLRHNGTKNVQKIKRHGRGKK